MSDALWQLGGWTMLHFLWVGAIVAALGAVVRLACRRAAPSVRYAISLITLSALAAAPIAIAAWLARFDEDVASMQPRALPGGSARVEPARTSTPGRSPGLHTGEPVVIDLARAESAAITHEPVSDDIPGERTTDGASEIDAKRLINPSPSPSAPQSLFDLRGSGMTIATVVAWLPWAWIVGAPVTFALLATGLVGSERLRCKSTLLTGNPAADACERLRVAMRIARRVSVAACDGLAQPVLIGIVRPLILLPASALSGWTPEELEMVLVHELAHVRRWDNLVNLVQRIVESLLFFHPAVWLASRQVRRDREECCDAAVVARTAQPQAYAELLVSIAAKMQAPRRAAYIAASAMADHPLAGRIRRILKLEDEPMWISRRTLIASIAIPAIFAAAIFNASHTSRRVEAEEPIAASNDASALEDVQSDTPQAGLGLDNLDVNVETSRLHAKIQRLGDLIAKEEKALLGAEIFKQLALQKARNPAAIEHAIAVSLEKDPNIVRYQSDIAELQGAIQERKSATRNPDDARLKQLTAQLEQTQTMMKQYRAAAEKSAREQIAKMPNEALRAAIVEHKIRFEAATANFEKYNNELAEANSALKALRADEEPIQKVYPIADIAKVDFQDWMRLIASDNRVNVQWFNNNRSIVISAPASQHDRIADFLSKTRRAAPGGQVEIEERVDPDAPPATHARASKRFEAFALKYARAPMVTLNLEEYFEKEVTADNVERLKFIWDSDTNSIVVQNASPEQLATIRDLIQHYDQPAANAGGEGRLERLREIVKQMLPLFEPGPDNPHMLGIYEYDEALPEFVDHWHYIVGGLNDRPKGKAFAFNWNRKSDHVEIEAPRAAHEQLFEPAFSGVDLLANESDEYRLHPGDRVKIEVVGAFPERPIDDVYTIEPIGTVPLGATYGRAKIVGLTVLEAEAAVKEHLKEILQDVEVQVTLDAPASSEPADTLSEYISQASAESDPITWQTDFDAAKAEAEKTGARILAFFHSPKSKPSKEYLRSVLESPEAAPKITANFVPLLIDVDSSPALAAKYDVDRVPATIFITHEGEVVKPLDLFAKPEDFLAAIGLNNRPSYLYDGKTFDEWRSLWKYELKTERRIEAINALAAFAHAGHSRQAAEAILDVAAEYDFTDLNDPGGKLKERVMEVLTLGNGPGVSAGDWLPPLFARLDKEPEKWRPLAQMLLTGFFPEQAPELTPAARELLLHVAREPKYGLNHEALYALWLGTPEDDGEVRRLVRDALAGKDVANALSVLGFTRFQERDQLPEQFDLLFHDDATVRRAVRTILGRMPPEDRQAAADRLVAVLDDAERASDHADAIRALGVLLNDDDQGRFSGVDERWKDNESRTALVDRLDQIVGSGPAELAAPALVAMGVSPEQIDAAMNSEDWDKTEEYTERVRKARDQIEAEAKRVTDQPPSGPGPGMEGGAGGGMF